MFILPTMSTIFIILSATLVAFGWWFIIKGKVKAHKRTMLTAAVFALIFFILYTTKSLIYGDKAFGGPDNIKIYYTIFLIFHIVLATTSAVFGVVTIALATKRKIRIHRKIGPVTSIMWFISAITGVMVYLLLYIIYDGGQNTNMLKAIFGI